MITVFGSLNLDLVMAVPALPRAGETVLAPAYEAFPGGKGANQAAAAARAGAKVRLFGRVGGDPFAEPVLAALGRAGVDISGVGRSARPTGVACVAVAPGGANQIVVASGANLAAEAAQVPDAALGAGTVVVLQNEVPVAETAALIGRASARGARVLLNLAPAGPFPAATLDRVAVLIVNEVEAAALAGREGEPARIGRLLAARHGLTVVVTLGAGGALAFDAGTDWRSPALPVTPVDTTGAGDAFVGVFAAAMDAGLDLGGCLRRASVAAGLSCLAKGAQAALPDAAAIEAALPDLPPPERRAR